MGGGWRRAASASARAGQGLVSCDWRGLAAAAWGCGAAATDQGFRAGGAPFSEGKRPPYPCPVIVVLGAMSISWPPPSPPLL
jgi:hypothetical protein